MKVRFFIILIVYPFTLIGNTSLIYKMLYINSLIPQNTDLRNRVLTTTCCDDCSYLPRVENAGNIVYPSDGSPYQLMHNGIKVLKDCYYGSWMTTLIHLLHGHHEPQEEKAFYEVLKYIPSGATMVELGSYWGFYSMWFQQTITDAKNYLIEPDPKNIIIGKYNFDLNNMHGSFTQAMISEKSSKNATFIDWDYNEHTIPSVSIDDFANQNNIPFIHILHSDIQGAEVDMLKGCSQLIAEKRIGYFFVSTHRGVHDACLQILQDAGLDILVSVSRDESFSADGLIVAKLNDMPGPSSIDVSKRTDAFRTLINEVTNESK